jgi:hypothetical protein
MATDQNPTTPDYRDILLRLIGSLTLADHMGDISDDVTTALKMAGIDVEWEDWDDLGSALHKMGVTTLHGTSLSSDDEDENDDG